ncbi:MAG: putative sulfate exporter family transporter [Bacteroidales bacterium]
MTKKIIFISLLILSIFISPALALFLGITYAFIFPHPYPLLSNRLSKYLLQISVVGLGFGMNLYDSLQSSSVGMMMTIFSVVGVMGIGYLLGKLFKIDHCVSYLISSGTAICGGSAIAAIAPVVKANQCQTSVSLAVIFTLNAIALFIFPSIGHFFDLSQQDFGMWAAIAIHDTSSVVGAAAAYGEEALMIATTVKLTRALWIIPLALVSIFFFQNQEGGKDKIAIPYFIFFFILAMILNTYLPIPSIFLTGIRIFSHKALAATLFLIGTSLSIKALKNVGIKPILVGISLWALISIFSLIFIIHF